MAYGRRRARRRGLVLRISRRSLLAGRIALYLLILAIAVPLLTEGGARVIYAVRYGNANYLRYPTNAPVAPDAIAISIAITNPHQPVPLPPGSHAFGPPDTPHHHVPINDSGFRGRDITAPKEADVRVVCLGGSSTFSAGCPVGTSYPEVLEALWSQQHGDGAVEVLNMGMLGYSSFDIAALFRDEVVGRGVDLATVCVAFNNLQGFRLLDLRPGIAPWHRQALWGRSLFYTVVFNGLRARASLYRPWENLVARYRADLEAMIELAHSEAIQLLFVLQPLADPALVEDRAIRERLDQPDDDLGSIRADFERSALRHGPLLDELVDVADRHGVPWVDPRGPLVEHPHPEDYFQMFLHLTPAGSQVMAEEIHREVETRYGGLYGLLDRPKPAAQPIQPGVSAVTPCSSESQHSPRRSTSRSPVSQKPRSSGR